MSKSYFSDYSEPELVATLRFFLTSPHEWTTKMAMKWLIEEIGKTEEQARLLIVEALLTKE